MRVFGYDIKRNGGSLSIEKAAGLRPVVPGQGWHRIIEEVFTGAWQRNMGMVEETALENFAVYACVSRISQDISKIPFVLKRKGEHGIYEEVTNSAYSKVLRRPNRYQNHQQFKENWMVSKLTHGNTYSLKERDARGVVSALYLLDPNRVTPLVGDDGSVYYRLKPDNLSSLGIDGEDITVPASEIIHDRYMPLWHPLVGVSPLVAYASAAQNGLQIQKQSSLFWANAARPSGIIEIPGKPTKEQGEAIKANFQNYFSGDNAGKIAVLADGMVFKPVTVTPLDSQMVEQLRLTADIICAVFGVPKHFVLGADPTTNNIEALSQSYYSQCLQSHIESMENLMDEGLDVDMNTYSIELDLDQLLRMDTASRFKAHSDAINGGWMAPNEARRKEGMAPVPGGDTPYLQQQNYSLAALGKRDSQENPFGPPPSSVLPAAEQTVQAPVDTEVDSGDDTQEAERLLVAEFARALLENDKDEQDE